MLLRGRINPLGEEMTCNCFLCAGKPVSMVEAGMNRREVEIVLLKIIRTLALLAILVVIVAMLVTPAGVSGLPSWLVFTAEHWGLFWGCSLAVVALAQIGLSILETDDDHPVSDHDESVG